MILGIESSCDDSSIALMSLDDLQLKFYEKISQEEQHSQFGGVVPELAARLHTKALPDILRKIKPFLKDVKGVAVTNEPGLSVSLISGVSMAKTISMSLKIPLMGVNHLVGHIYSLFLQSDMIFPIGILLVSGGHTMILKVDSYDEIYILASTSDDSFGESFDKVAKMLNLGYPGGAIIEKLAKNGDCDRFKFTIPLLHDKRLEYSFSGLKNQVRLQIESLKQNNCLKEQDINDICASFQKIACNHIMNKLEKIFNIYKFKNFGVVGGASANLELRSKIERLCDKNQSKLFLAPLKFCSDNAAMIARVGVEKYKRGEFIDYKQLKINPTTNFKKRLLNN